MTPMRPGRGPIVISFTRIVGIIVLLLAFANASGGAAKVGLVLFIVGGIFAALKRRGVKWSP